MWDSGRPDFHGIATDWDDPRLDVAPTTPKRQKGDDSRIRRGGADDDEEPGMVAAVCEEELPTIDIDDLVIPGLAYYDQVTGERLDPEEVAGARKKEIDCMEEHEFYEWVREDTLSPDEQIIDSRFNDLRKASGLLRERCVGRQYAEEA